MEPCGSQEVHAGHHYMATDSNGYWCEGLAAEPLKDRVEYTDTHKVWHYPHGSTLSVDRCLLDPEDAGYLRPDEQPHDGCLQTTSDGHRR